MPLCGIGNLTSGLVDLGDLPGNDGGDLLTDGRREAGVVGGKGVVGLRQENGVLGVAPEVVLACGDHKGPQF